MALNYIYFHFCFQWLCLNSSFASLVAIPIGITSSAEGIKITAGIKKYKSVIKKRKKKTLSCSVISKN